MYKCVCLCMGQCTSDRKHLCRLAKGVESSRAGASESCVLPQVGTGDGIGVLRKIDTCSELLSHLVPSPLSFRELTLEKVEYILLIVD